MTHSDRINLGKQHPAAYKTLLSLSSVASHADRIAKRSGLSPLLRASRECIRGD